MPVADVLREFDQNSSIYVAFASKLEELIRELLRESGVRSHNVSSRSKSRESFAEKVSRVEGKYASVAAVTDTVGVRIITYFATDVDSVARVIEDGFDVDSENSVDKRRLSDPNRFGYASLHFVVSLRPDRAALPEYRRFTGLKAEIQIRSILQHAWAEIEHDRGYKGGAPARVRRQFSRLAGLLELADEEFESIRNNDAESVQNATERIRSDPRSVTLDVDSLKAFIGTSPLVAETDREIVQSAGGRIEANTSMQFAQEVRALHLLGLDTVAELERSLRLKRKKVLLFAAALLEGGETLGQGISLMYLAYTMLGERSDLVLASQFLKTFGVRESESAAVRILETYQGIRFRSV